MPGLASQITKDNFPFLSIRSVLTTLLYNIKQTLKQTVLYNILKAVHSTVHFTEQRRQTGWPILSGTQTSLSPLQCTAYYAEHCTLHCYDQCTEYSTVQ